MIIKIIIVGVVIIAGLALLYPNELIQFSKGSTIQENTEQGLSNLKNTSFDEIENTMTENFLKIKNTIENAFNEIFNS